MSLTHTHTQEKQGGEHQTDRVRERTSMMLSQATTERLCIKLFIGITYRLSWIAVLFAASLAFPPAESTFGFVGLILAISCLARAIGIAAISLLSEEQGGRPQ